MASGCPAVHTVRASAPSAALATRSASAGNQVGTAPALSGRQRQNTGLLPHFSALRRTSGEVGRQILALGPASVAKATRPIRPQTILTARHFAISKLTVHDIIVLTTANGFRFVHTGI